MIPSSPYDAKGLLKAAIDDPNPVLFFEHKALYRSLKEKYLLNRILSPWKVLEWFLKAQI